jgi:hypothetical protein
MCSSAQRSTTLPPTTISQQKHALHMYCQCANTHCLHAHTHTHTCTVMHTYACLHTHTHVHITHVCMHIYSYVHRWGEGPAADRRRASANFNTLNRSMTQSLNFTFGAQSSTRSFAETELPPSTRYSTSGNKRPAMLSFVEVSSTY